jgi:hypothetical protein
MNAQPARPAGTRRATPAMEARREGAGRGRASRPWERGGPCGAPQPWRGKRRRRACAGRLESWRRARRGARTPPGAERGAWHPGGPSGTGARQACPGPAARTRRGPGCTRALARTGGFQPSARRRRHTTTGSRPGMAWPAPRAAGRAGRLAGVVAPRPAAWWAQAPTRTGGDPRPTGPTAGQATPGSTTGGGKTGETLRAPTGATPLQRRAAQARPRPTRRCMTEAHRNAVERRRAASQRPRQAGAPGSDGVTAAE